VSTTGTALVHGEMYKEEELATSSYELKREVELIMLEIC
jgi:hypothetical protein